MKRRSRTLLNSVFIVALLSGVAVNAVIASHFGLLGDYYGPPPGVPSAPQNVQAVSACESIQVVWSPPATDGGSPVNGYIIRVRVGGNVVQTSTVDANTYSTTVTGLTDGTDYTVTVSAVNSAGEGPESAAIDVVPLCVPTAPIAVAAAPLCNATRVTWGAPSHDGGRPIAGYVVWVRNGGQLVASDRVASTDVHDQIDGLANGTTYDVTVSALNVLGVGPPSTVVTVTPQCGPSIPTAPIEVFGSPTCSGANVSWSPPVQPGGQINGYIVFVRQSGGIVATDVTDGSTFTDGISGLTNGADYQITVAAVNVHGVGAESTVVDLVPECPAAAPDPPFQVSAAPLCGGLEVTWNAPLNDGGSSVTGYTVFVRQGDSIVATDNVDASTFVDDITGLTNGASYSITVAATNANGMGAESSPSVAVSPECPATVPDPPQLVSATPQCESVNVGWNAPGNDGGVPITSYTVYVHNGEQLVTSDTVSASQLSDVISGLTDGTSYTVTVVATNQIGDSSASNGMSVTPVCAPTVPLSVTAAPLCESTNVGWSTPTSDGGSAITSYTVTVYDGLNVVATDTVSPSQLSDVISGLTDGTSYTVTVFATNAIGDSNATDPVTVTPVCHPTVPLSLTAAPRCESANVGWSTPTSDGGSAITSYTVTVYDGLNVAATDTVPASQLSDVISGLTDGTSYTVTVVATNAIGDSNATSAVSVTPVCAPTVPLSVAADPKCGGATLTWTPPANGGGSPITSYTVLVRNGSQLVTDTVSGSTLTDNITDLTGGVTYSATVEATNAIGTGAESGPPVTFVPTCLPTSLQYTGDLSVKLPAALHVSAQLSSATAGCKASQTLSFFLDKNPVTLASGPFALATKKTGGTGIASFAVATSKWHAGSYTVTVIYAGTPPVGGKQQKAIPHCTPAIDSAPITAFAVPRGPQIVGASGVGTIPDNGGTTFAFSMTAPKGTTDWTGPFLLTNDNSWRLVGSITGYTKTSRTTATATATADLYYQASDRTWQLAESDVPVALTMSAGGKKKGKLGIQITYTPVPPQPSLLPNTLPLVLTVGTITVH